MHNNYKTKLNTKSEKKSQPPPKNYKDLMVMPLHTPRHCNRFAHHWDKS